MLSEKFPFLTQENVKDVLTLSFLAAISHMEEKLLDVVLNLELQENKSRYNKCFLTAETKRYKNPSVVI